MIFYIREIQIDIFISHRKTDKLYVAKIILTEVFSPSERNVASFDDQVLVVLYGRLYHLPDNGPQIFSELVVVFGSKVSIAAPYKAHLQMVYRYVRIVMLFEELLRQNGLSRM